MIAHVYIAANVADFDGNRIEFVHYEYYVDIKSQSGAKRFFSVFRNLFQQRRAS